MATIENLDLLNLKKKLIACDLSLKDLHTIDLSYHDIPLRFHTRDQNLIECINNYFPISWNGCLKDQYRYEVFHSSPKDHGVDSKDFEDEKSQDCYLSTLENQELAVQRDFVATRSGNKVKAIFDATVDDGFFNFFRWLICRDFLKHNKAVLHSSCIIGKNNKAYVFLGPSGAGKTTTCLNAEDRKILGDDMNVIVLRDDKVYMQPGSIGGRFESQIPFDQLVEVHGFYWLNQSQTLALEPLSSSRSVQALVASLANMFWRDDDLEIGKEAATFCCKIQKLTPSYKLSLQNNSLFWQLIEPKLIEITVSGQSMMPTLQHGQLICVQTDYRLKKGRIYLYKDLSKKLIVHRLISTQPIILKGDFSLSIDFIGKENIVGEVLLEEHPFKQMLIVFFTKFNTSQKNRIVRVLSRFFINLISFKP